MARISKATIKASKNGGRKKGSCVILTTIFILFVALLNVFTNESAGVTLKDVERSVSGSSIASSSQSQGDVVTVTPSDTIAHPSNDAGRPNNNNNNSKDNSDNNNNAAAITNGNTNAVAISNGSSNDPFYPSGVDGKHLQYLFHHTPSDRSGKEAHVILDMMMGHAYVFHQQQLYGGSCGSGNDVGRDPERALLKAIGLDHILRFACPGDIKNKMRQKEIPSKSYQQDGARSLTPAYMELLRSAMHYPERKDDKFTIAVHIRRNKITPCRKQFQGYDPYLPNKHYQLLIDKYMKPNSRVVIYSQEPSHESLDEFRDKGYEVNTSEAMADVWTAALTADVFIMSRSDFSFVPAILTKATVVYTPFWEKAHRGWDIVGKDVMEQTTAEFERLSSACPKDSKLSKLRQRMGHH